MIYDSPTASYDENHNLSFNDAFVQVYDRQMEQDGVCMGELQYDEETESLRLIDAYPLSPSEYDDIRVLIMVLE